MTVTPHTYADLAVKQDQLIRKALDGSVFGGASSVAAITALTVDGPVTGTPTLALLPDGYDDFGLISDNGAKFTTDLASADIMSWGRVEPSRRDITKDITNLQIVCQETKLATVAAYNGVDPALLVPDPTTGELHVTKPSRPTVVTYRLLTLGVDQNAGGEIYCACFMPRASVTNKGDIAFMSGADGIFYDTTWTAYSDSTLGFAVRFIFGGPGWKSMLTAMGF